MGAGEGLAAAQESLIGREADAVVESIVRLHPRELRDNPDGVELLGDAVCDAIGPGLESGREHAGRAVGERATSASRPPRPAPRSRGR